MRHSNVRRQATWAQRRAWPFTLGRSAAAWEDAYDWAVLVSSDRDFIPAVELFNAKGRKVLHAGFPPRGSQLATKCWGSLDLRPYPGRLERGQAK